MMTIPLLLLPTQAYKRVMKLVLRSQAAILAFALASTTLFGQATSQIQGVIVGPLLHERRSRQRTREILRRCYSVQS
jgi:hypothetical protein